MLTTLTRVTSHLNQLYCHQWLTRTRRGIGRFDMTRWTPTPQVGSYSESSQTWLLTVEHVRWVIIVRATVSDAFTLQKPMKHYVRQMLRRLSVRHADNP